MKNIKSDIDQGSYDQLLRQTYREAVTTAILTMRQFQRELPVLIKTPRQMALLMQRNNVCLHEINTMCEQLRRGQTER